MKTIFNTIEEAIVRKQLTFIILLALSLTACGQPQAAPSGSLSVIASTQLIGDVVSQIAGDEVSVTVLIPAGSDPHSFEPGPQDAALLTDADLVFVNGFGLEESLHDLLEALPDTVVEVSDGVASLEFEHGEEEEGDEHEGDEHEHEGSDPHIWMNPQNVKVWADNIATALSAADPSSASEYKANAQAYKDELDALDAWAGEQIALIPAEQRVLVTDHEAFGYFAEHYGFDLVGALIPSYSTLSEPSAGELAGLEDAIGTHGVNVIFVSSSVNPALAERVAADTGIVLVQLYAESLSGVDGPAPTYIDMMRYNVQAIVDALK